MSVTGRFAPSPTGPLHFGSVVAAVASYMHAKRQGGKWLLRMDDLDTPRCIAGMDTAIMKSLEILGLHWDDEIMFQSRRNDAYLEVLDTLSDKQLIYRCTCTRKQLRGHAYPGTCRKKKHPPEQHHSLRMITDETPVEFGDIIHGHFRQNLSTEVGDFIVRRADDIVAYDIAVVVDDACQGVTEIVRGADLLDVTPRQIYLQQILDYPHPSYAHLPVAVDAYGYKLSKQHHARPVDDKQPVATLFSALDFLGQQPDKALLECDAGEIVQWGISHWSMKKVPVKLKLEI